MAKQTKAYHGCDPYLFIVGCARSGTTLVHRIVDAHPHIAITPEMHWITRQFQSRNALVIPELVSGLTRHKRFAQFENPRQQFEGLLGSGEPVPYPTFLSRLFGLYGRIISKPLVGNKTVDHALSLRTLNALFPAARFVHLIRDGRDVALSWIGAPFGPKTVHSAARLWARYLDRAAELRASTPPATAR
jgi:hypothetical protein